MKEETVAYVHVADGQWVFAQPGKTLNELKEKERDDTQVVLENTRTKLLIRLTPGQSFWKQPSDSEWTRYYRGQWTTPPESVRNWIAEKTDNAPDSEPKHPNETSQDDYRVRVIYFVPFDRQPVANWEAKIRVLIHFVDSFYRNDLDTKGIKSSGLKWETLDDEDRVQVHLAQGKRPASFYNDAPAFNKNTQFQRIANELRQTQYGKPGTVRLVLCETYDMGPSDLLWNGTFALGAYNSAKDGLAMFSAHILRDEFCATSPQEQVPKFFDTTPVMGRRAMGHAMNSPRREFAEDGFGAVIHELGHALGLPHDFRNHDRFVMGNGFRQLARNLNPRTPSSRSVTFSDVSTLLLSSSRFLNPDIDRTDNEPAKAEFNVRTLQNSGNSVHLQLIGSDAQGLRAFAVIDNHAESPVAAGHLEGKQFQQDITVGYTPKSGQGKLTLILVDQGGNQTRVVQTFARSP